MDLRHQHAPDPAGFSRMSTSEIRRCFLLQDLFESGHVRMVHSDIDRAVLGGAYPGVTRLVLEAPAGLSTDSFTRRREIGVVNIGSTGRVHVGSDTFRLDHRDVLYVGSGGATVEFEGSEGAEPAVFYFVSYPAHASHPAKLVRRADAEVTTLGGPAGANRRTIRKYIHPGAVEASQLTLGITDLDAGSVWNTMPVHRHSRRSEIYFYFGLPADAVLFHFLGEPQETRHVVIRDREAVLAPSWSIHSGVGTAHYSFVWAMGGENREFSDMDAVAMQTLA